MRGMHSLCSYHACMIQPCQSLMQWQLHNCQSGQNQRGHVPNSPNLFPCLRALTPETHIRANRWAICAVPLQRLKTRETHTAAGITCWSSRIWPLMFRTMVAAAASSISALSVLFPWTHAALHLIWRMQHFT